MPEILVTVVGGVHRGAMSLDADVPLANLMADLVRHYAGADRDPVQMDLVKADGTILPPQLSLAKSKVAHGEELTLRPRRQRPPLAAVRPQPKPTRPVTMKTAKPEVRPLAPASPMTLARGALPERLRLWHRLALAFAAGVHKVEPAPASNLDGLMGPTPSPAALTRPEPSGPLTRAKTGWRTSNYLYQLDETIVSPRLINCATIAVVSPKGGVGKTTICALLGTLLSYLRRDLVLAIDANPDFGSLGRVLCPTQLSPGRMTYVDDMVRYLETCTPTLSDLNTRLGVGPHGLRVLPAPTDPHRMAEIGFGTYHDVIERLADYAGVILLDCGTGLQEPAAEAALEAADQIIVVSDADPATASLVAEAAHLMALKAPLTLVVNKVPAGGGRLDLERLAEVIPDAAHMVVIPTDAKDAARLGVGAFTWQGVSSSWQRAFRELAAVMVTEWSGLGLAHTI